MFTPDLVELAKLVKEHGYATVIVVLGGVTLTVWRLSIVVNGWLTKVDDVHTLASGVNDRLQVIESNHLTHIEHHTEATVKAIEKQTELLEKIALRDCPLMRANFTLKDSE